MLFFSTGKPDLDKMLGGGIASGRISTIRGEVCSGKSMLLESILSNTSHSVIHFLTEQKMPKYISVKKENYTFMETRNLDEIRDKVTSLWINGFNGLIAIDPIDRLDVDRPSKDFGDKIKTLQAFLHWFISNAPEHPEKSRLGANSCSLIFTKKSEQMRLVPGNAMRFGELSTICSESVEMSHLSGQQIDTKITPEKRICVSISKNKYAPITKACCEFDFNDQGIK